MSTIYLTTEEVFRVVPEHAPSLSQYFFLGSYAAPAPEAAVDLPEWEKEHITYTSAQYAGEDMLRHHLLKGTRLEGFSIRKFHKLVTS